MDKTVQTPVSRRIRWQNVSTVLSAAILIGAEVFGAAFAGKFGGALDVFGDRYFMVISCLYIGFRGVSLIPLAMILLREIYSVSLRMVQIDGEG